MLAGRKLLLADDSVTIQKVIDLTFADEGVEVITVGDGEKAIEKVEELLPDVVLVDVFMPIFNGYEVCEYIKGSEKLKHIPVMLLVGSFEPFDEAEARRVGANDTLTKPFQSIRKLIEKVGDLVSGKPPESESPTAQLPQDETPEEMKLSTAELDIVTADTMKFPDELKSHFQEVATREEEAHPPVSEESPMLREPEEPQTRMSIDNNDVLLDLDDFETADSVADDDFELELDLDEPEMAPAPVAYSPGVEAQTAIAPALVRWEEQPHESHRGEVEASQTAPPSEVTEPVFEQQDYQPFVTPVASTDVASHLIPGSISAGTLSQEQIDAIAMRAVEFLSEKVIREIAWEVVPQLAELMIKRQLEEKESQAK